MTTSHDYSNIQENFKIAKEMSKKRKAVSKDYRKGKSRNLYSMADVISDENWDKIFKSKIA